MERDETGYRYGVKWNIMLHINRVKINMELGTKLYNGGLSFSGSFCRENGFHAGH